MKRLIALSLAVLLMAALAGCGNMFKEWGVEDFNIYSNGDKIADISGLTQENSMFSMLYFTQANQYQMEPTSLETRRGIRLGSEESDLLSAYGDYDCEVYLTSTISTFADGKLFKDLYEDIKEQGYNVNFRGFTVDGAWQTDFDEVRALILENREGDGATVIEEYNLVFTVVTGKVTEVMLTYTKY